MPKAQSQPPGRPADKSMQININSPDDARAVIQHLPLIKKTWDTLHDTAGVTSVEFCIAEPIKSKVDAMLIGAIPWCRTYVKAVVPFEGNVHFPLPHCVPAPAINGRSSRIVTTPTEPTPAEPATKVNRYLRSQSPPATPSPTPGKPERPVPAPVSGA